MPGLDTGCSLKYLAGEGAGPSFFHFQQCYLRRSDCTGTSKSKLSVTCHAPSRGEPEMAETFLRSIPVPVGHLAVSGRWCSFEKRLASRNIHVHLVERLISNKGHPSSRQGCDCVAKYSVFYLRVNLRTAPRWS